MPKSLGLKRQEALTRMLARPHHKNIAADMRKKPGPRRTPEERQAEIDRLHALSRLGSYDPRKVNLS